MNSDDVMEVCARMERRLTRKAEEMQRIDAVRRPMSRRVGRKRKSAAVTLHDGLGPTHERLIHAEATGVELAVETYVTDRGEETQLKRQRIVNPLEQLWKAGVLDAGQYGAARRYQRDADMAAVVGPGATVRYEPRMIEDGGQRFLLPIEAATDYLVRLAAAHARCGPKRRHMLDWIATERVGWRQQAREWFPTASELWARSSFQRLLRSTCSILEAHYKR